MTNADKIRAMTDEDLNDLFMIEYDGSYIFWRPVNSNQCKRKECRECFLDWLKQEVEI